MKITEKISAERYREAWQAAMAGDKSWLYDSEVSLSPAAQAQALPEGIMSTGPMPHLSPMHGMYNAWEYTNWKEEALAITQTGYIGDWTYLKKMKIKGPDAVECMKQSTIVKFNVFPVGKAKHCIAVREDGKIIVDALAFRLAEDEILVTGGQPVGQIINGSGLDVEINDCSFDDFEFHVQGPVSRNVLEKACGESFADLKFTWFTYSQIAGRKVRVYRGGMSGELGYEIHGNVEDGSIVWNAIVEAGKEFGLKQQGHRTMPFNHLEAYFPTCWLDYIPATFHADPETEDMLFHSPVEYGWITTIDFERDFPARKALLEELDNPKKKTVMLEWNSEDVLKIYESLFDDETESIDLPALPVKISETGFAFAVPVYSRDMKKIGYATNRGYSPRTKKFVSITSMKAEYCEIGSEVLVKYGDEGKRQIMIRATVKETPYKPDNRK